MSNFRYDLVRERQLLVEQRAAEKKALEKKAAEARALEQAKKEANYLVTGAATLTLFTVAAAGAILCAGSTPLKITSKY